MLTQLHTTNHSQNVFAPSLYYKLPSLDLKLIICPSLRTNYTLSVGSSPLMSSACLLMVKGHQVLMGLSVCHLVCHAADVAEGPA